MRYDVPASTAPPAHPRRKMRAGEIVYSVVDTLLFKFEKIIFLSQNRCAQLAHEDLADGPASRRDRSPTEADAEEEAGTASAGAPGAAGPPADPITDRCQPAVAPPACRPHGVMAAQACGGGAASKISRGTGVGPLGVQQATQKRARTGSNASVCTVGTRSASTWPPLLVSSPVQLAYGCAARCFAPFCSRAVGQSQVYWYRRTLAQRTGTHERQAECHGES
jgi:hypothetical protein